MKQWLQKRFAVIEGSASRVDESVDTVDSNEVKPGRRGMRLLLLGFGGFVLWAAFAPLDSGVQAPGTVKVANNRKTVQHLSGGTIDAILVKEGQSVQQGQELVRLNPTQIDAQLGMTVAQFIAARTIEARLLAERDNLPAVVFPADLAPYAADPRLVEAKALQTRLFATRRSTVTSEISILDENLSGAHEQLKGLEAVRDTRSEQIRLIRDELSGMRDLARDGYLPRNRLLEQERNAAQLTGALAEDVANIGRTRNQMAELKLRMLQRRQEYQKEVQSQLGEIQKEASALAERLDGLNYELANTRVRAPMAGVVVGLNVHTVGGVIPPGGRVMDVVPGGEPLIVEAHVPTHLIDKLHPGLAVDVTFPALNHAQTPNIPGELDTVSADALIDETTRMPYYLAQIKVRPEGMAMLKQQVIRPGMPASVLIKTGERTMLNYMVKPLTDRFAAAFKEQ